MCGIAGYIDLQKDCDAESIRAMADALRHRGPDDSGTVCLGRVALGHRRLSIIDLSPNARQPMRNKDGAVWIIFNGEFYNFQEYRSQLTRMGYEFVSQSDTEVILHLYEAFGIEKTLAAMNGMYAFAIYDQKLQRLFIARDRLGVKPCYYARQGDRLYWGSELKALVAHPEFRAEVSSQAFCDYLAYQYLSDDSCIYEGVRKIEPGHYLEIDVRTLEYADKSYWDLHYEPVYGTSENQWLEELDALLADAVRIRLISDVPLGAFLSGGIDSTLIVSYMARLMNVPVSTFTIGFAHAAFSEAAWAAEVSKKFNTEHREQYVEPDAVSLLPLLAYHFDEPFGDSSAIPTYCVSRVARSKVTVILSGDGGDESFGGYSKYKFALKLLGLHRAVPRPIRRAIFQSLFRMIPGGLPGKNICDFLRGDVKHLYESKNRFFRDDELRGLLRDPRKPADVFSKYFDRMGEKAFLSQMQYIDIKTYLPMDILTKVDRASMAVALETRGPLLDYRIVELAAKVPPELHVKNGETKYLLKRLLRDTFGFNDEFLGRPKRGFSIPLRHWFKGNLEPFAMEQLCDSSSRISDAVHQDFIGGMIRRHQRGMKDYSAQIWSLLFLEYWLRRWCGGAASSTGATNAGGA